MQLIVFFSSSSLFRWRETPQVFGHAWNPFYWVPCRSVTCVASSWTDKIHSHNWFGMFNTMFNAVVGFPLLQTGSPLPSQDVQLRSNARRLLSQVELVHVEAHSLREAPAAGRAGVALLWDLWPADRSSPRGATGISRVLLPVLFSQRAGPAEEQGWNQCWLTMCDIPMCQYCPNTDVWWWHWQLTASFVLQQPP